MKLWIGVTDEGWYEFLRRRNPDEVNFWQPGGGRQFRALQPGEPFLFKLHSPKNYIVGGGFFVRFSPLPCSLAWEALGEKNGVKSYAEFLGRIRKYRVAGGNAGRVEPDPVVGCNVLAQPFFFPESSWIPIPADWSPNIVQGKTYDTEQAAGRALWGRVKDMALSLSLWPSEETGIAKDDERPKYLVAGRLGQGAFRILVTDAYQRRCAITGERTLPVLEAAHIRPYSDQGPNVIRNGLLLRSDLHKLFDIGYLTVSPDYHVEISKRIREEYANGHEYYAHHGQKLAVLPQSADERPSREFLDWHNQSVFVP